MTTIRALARHQTDEAAPTKGLVDVVVKVGGSLLELDGALPRACSALAALARRERILVVPGGGRFADAVRAADDAHGLDPNSAHWMAILAMDQYAHLLASLLDGAALIEQPAAIAAQLSCGRVPILAPYRWLREADPLPHSWDVTSDSIAAWVAGALGASRLVLIKPVGGPTEHLVDAHFAAALPESVVCEVVGADDIESIGLREAHDRLRRATSEGQSQGQGQTRG
jgi:aspartokinase-like uncharacterized kinase